MFPAIRELEAGAVDKTAASAALESAFEKLEVEHQKTGAALARFHELTDGYTTPDWACNTFRALYDGLQQIEKDMHQHIHEENNVLFPRALAL